MKKKLSYNQLLSVVAIVAMIVLIVMMLINLFPLLQLVMENTKDESVMVEYIREYGSNAIPVLIGLQALQVVMVFVPAAAVQVLAGLCYGKWVGMLTSVAGYIVGNTIVFTAVRGFHKTLKPRKKKKKGKEPLFNLNKLKAMQHPEYLAFFLYLIPGLPNGALPYIFADTKISLRKYLLAIVAASIPSSLVCTALGEYLRDQEYGKAAIVGAIMLLTSGLIFLFRKQISAKMNGDSPEGEEA